ncbi:MAG: hypothetical protein ACYC27_06325 [Armatimonadota bacterium]
MSKRILLIILLVIPGMAVMVVSGYYALLDWDRLQTAYNHFQSLSSADADLKSLFTAQSVQNIHRINLFAEVVWGLLGAILAGIGLHGLCIMPESCQKAPKAYK